MTRIPDITERSQLPEDQQHNWDIIMKNRGYVGSVFGVMLHSPELAGRTAHLGEYVRFQQSLPEGLRALAALVTARHFDCQFDFSANVRGALQAGIREAAIEAIRDRRAPQGLEGDEALVFRVGNELLAGRHRLSEATFQEAVERFGLPGLTDLLGTIGYFAHVSVTLNAYAVSREDRPSMFPEP